MAPDYCVGLHSWLVHVSVALTSANEPPKYRSILCVQPIETRVFKYTHKKTTSLRRPRSSSDSRRTRTHTIIIKSVNKRIICALTNVGHDVVYDDDDDDDSII